MDWSRWYRNFYNLLKQFFKSTAHGQIHEDDILIFLWTDGVSVKNVMIDSMNTELLPLVNPTFSVVSAAR